MKKHPYQVLLLKYAFTLIALMIVYFNVNAQSSSSSGWTVLKDTSNITVSFKYVTCGTDNKVLLKFENNDSTNSASFSWQLYFDGTNVSETLSSSELKFGDCTGANSYLSRKVPSGFPYGDATPPLFLITF
ncbi:MAG: hypothetical protein WCO54_05350 [Bacteroidota bacterium]